MKLLRQWALIIGICFLGELLQKTLKLPLPGNVLGMIILFILLVTKAVKVDFLEESSNFLINHLSFFFIPASVSLMTNFEMLKGSMLKFAAICVITTIIVILVTGHIVQAINKASDNKGKGGLNY